MAEAWPRVLLAMNLDRSEAVPLSAMCLRMLGGMMEQQTRRLAVEVMMKRVENMMFMGPNRRFFRVDCLS